MDSKSGANTEHLCSSLGTFAVLGRARFAAVFVDVKQGEKWGVRVWRMDSEQQVPIQRPASWSSTVYGEDSFSQVWHWCLYVVLFLESLFCSIGRLVCPVQREECSACVSFVIELAVFYSLLHHYCGYSGVSVFPYQFLNPPITTLHVNMAHF